MHNDGVAQGLSVVPFMQDVERWGVLTVGTGLGNARFTNRQQGKGQGRQEREEEKGLRRTDRLTVQVAWQVTL